MKDKVFTIVFAGDSTTDADKLNTDDRLGTGYVRFVQDELTAFYPQHIFKIINSGINGHTSRDLVNRWESDVTAHNPDITFCMIGINDVWRHFDYRGFPEEVDMPVAEYEKNLTEIAQKAQGKSKLFFMTPFFMERNCEDEMRKLTDEYQGVMRKVAEKFSIPVIDIQAGFDEYMRYRPGQSISWDRVHPGTVGSHIIGKRVMHALESIIMR